MKAQIIDEHIPLNHSFAVFHKICDEYPFVWHYHPSCEIFFPTRGKGKYIVGTHLGTFSANEIIFAGENLPHVFYTTGLNKKNTYEFYKIHFQYSLIEKLTSVFKETSLIKKIISSPSASFICKKNNYKTIKKVKKIYTNFSRNSLYNIAIFLELLYDLIENHSVQNLSELSSLSNYSSFDVERLKKICNFLVKNFHRQIRLTEVANLAAMSISNLCAFFKKTTNISIIDYVNRLRIEQACHMLRETNDSISSIALSCGYKGTSHFNRQFIKYKNLSPKEFKRKF